MAKLLKTIPICAAVLGLSACIPFSEAPKSSRSNSAFSSPDARLCLSNLERAKISFAALPDTQYGGGCQAVNSVRLIDFGTPTSNLGPMTCNLASGFTGWARDVVRPAARKYLGSDLARIETSGTYSCRRVSGSGNLSQHASANAVDVFAFVTKDGRRVTVLNGWNGDSRESKFLRQIHADACGRFGTVLGPQYNQQHRNHFHLDMSPSRLNGNSYCR
ncbi:extensin family protein [Sphingorhabdus arenilitoris]|uniref:Extensin family protein n=1 Tax=Sphingorhabdus arenilitoris TaxID=1490041 RepID=A0ABV8REB3_9SPHN